MGAMADEELEPIEGVILDEHIDETPTEIVAKKPLDDYGKQIARFSFLANLFLRYGPTLFAISALATMAFWILAQQHEYQGVFLVLLIIMACMTLVGLVAFVLGMICRKIAISYMKRDPNYASRVQ
ncbi:MAG: hypothetical protein II520_04035, partial [Bacilli bacterium]|nr:hypothetical protein [Bacilli bacterium]